MSSQCTCTYVYVYAYTYIRNASRITMQSISALIVTSKCCHICYLDPKILPCCHYYCNECVRALADRGNPFACPQCRKPAQLPANRDPAVLPTAYFVNRIKDVHGKMEKARGRVAARCEMCSEGKAEAFCRQCTEFICSDCARSHEKMKTKFPGHKAVSLEELRVGGAKQIPTTPAPPMTCDAHEKRMKLYCFDCGSLICRDCTVVDHIGHKFEFAKKCAVEYRSKASEGIQQLAEIASGIFDTIKRTKEREDEIHEEGRQVSASITATFDDIRRILAHHEAKLQKEASELVETKLASLTVRGKNLQLELAEVQSLSDFVQRNVEGATDEELMTVHKQIESNVVEQRQRFTQLDREPIEEANVSEKFSIATALRQFTAEITHDPSQCSVEEANVSKEISITAAFQRFTTEITPDPSQCSVFGPGLETTEIGKETHVTVAAVFTDGHCSEIPLAVEGEFSSRVDGSVIKIKGTSKGKGRYQLAYTPITRGRHSLSITVNGRQIAGSPFQSLVRLHPTQLRKPVKSIKVVGNACAIAIAADEKFVVSSEQKIVILAKSGKKLNTIACSGQPTGVAVDDIGHIYVALWDDVIDSTIYDEVNCLCKFDESGRKLKEVKGKLQTPSGVTIINNQVFVCDRGNHRIAVFSTELELIRCFGTNGSGDGQFRFPEFIIKDGEGQLWITDSNNHRLCVFTADGKYLRSVVKPADKGKLNQPVGIACDSDYVYVSELGRHCVSVFTVAGDFVCSFGGRGGGEGEFVNPFGVSVDRDGFLYVCDLGNFRIQVY